MRFYKIIIKNSDLQQIDFINIMRGGGERQKWHLE